MEPPHDEPDTTRAWAPRWLVGAVTAVAGAALVWGAMAHWYTLTRVDHDAGPVPGVALASVFAPPLVAALVATVLRRPLPAWVGPVVASTIALGLVVGQGAPRALEASATDTALVMGPAPTRLAVAAGLASVAVLGATRRSRPVDVATLGARG